MIAWLQGLQRCAAEGEPAVLVTVAAAAGSVPREAGAKMLVTAGGLAGSIGGGTLEHQAIRQARAMLDEPAPPRLDRVPLGPRLGQCCGGTATLLLERVAPGAAWVAALQGLLAGGGRARVETDLATGEKRLQPGGPPMAPVLGGASFDETLSAATFIVCLYGAGHVGQALAPLLAGLDARVLWIDPRPEAFPPALPPGVECRSDDPPERAGDDAPADAVHLVMTHSHALDLAICARLLSRGRFGFLGLIGSRTKRATFLRRLAARGIPEPALARLVCPVGLPGIADKRPAAIAVAVAAQLLQRQAAVDEAAILTAAARR